MALKYLVVFKIKRLKLFTFSVLLVLTYLVLAPKPSVPTLTEFGSFMV